MIDILQFTGERVVPNKTCHPLTMAEHLIRYSLATQYAKGGKILDVACGTGYGLKIMGWLGAEKYGADISDEALQTAKELNRDDILVTKIDFEKERLNYSPDFDLITSFETIEHLENPDLFLQGIADALKDTGKFIYSIPLANPSKYHKVVYTFESAIELIQKYFEHEEIFIQESLELVNFKRMNGNVNNLNKRGIFVIGVCHKKVCQDKKN
jgi:2-polyprenyl-3-methyl-5-hydroxy-6-metoxy-1,4-benzoquinol methylase